MLATEPDEQHIVVAGAAAFGRSTAVDSLGSFGAVEQHSPWQDAQSAVRSRHAVQEASLGVGP